MKRGTPLEPAAAIDGIPLTVGVGLLIMTPFAWSGTRANEVSVAMLDVDILLAGEAGRAAFVKGEGEG